ncbi:hypothetical protein C8Q80DRAFT_302840 [Daedaleopsis nitida]|nr:hypothetical protein C8Q80DRAFT_302840 [Daedaleopsis nitida]
MSISQRELAVRDDRGHSSGKESGHGLSETSSSVANGTTFPVVSLSSDPLTTTRHSRSTRSVTSSFSTSKSTSTKGPPPATGASTSVLEPPDSTTLLSLTSSLASSTPAASQVSSSMSHESLSISQASSAAASHPHTFSSLSSRSSSSPSCTSSITSKLPVLSPSPIPATSTSRQHTSADPKQRTEAPSSRSAMLVVASSTSELMSMPLVFRKHTGPHSTTTSSDTSPTNTASSASVLPTSSSTSVSDTASLLPSSTSSPSTSLVNPTPTVPINSAQSTTSVTSTRWSHETNSNSDGRQDQHSEYDIHRLLEIAIPVSVAFLLLLIVVLFLIWQNSKLRRKRRRASTALRQELFRRELQASMMAAAPALSSPPPPSRAIPAASGDKLPRWTPEPFSLDWPSSTTAFNDYGGTGMTETPNSNPATTASRGSSSRPLLRNHTDLTRTFDPGRDTATTVGSVQETKSSASESSPDTELGHAPSRRFWYAL